MRLSVAEVKRVGTDRRAIAHVKQCAVLYVHAGGNNLSAHVQLLSALGFVVRDTHEWPERDEDVMDYQVVIVRLDHGGEAPHVAARIRTKPRFGRRVLIALVPSDTPLAERRMAQSSGFDDVVSEDTEPRLLAARLMRILRQRPEYRCYLPRRKAA